MPNPGITDPHVLEAIIDLLEGIRTTAETDGAWAAAGNGPMPQQP